MLICEAIDEYLAVRKKKSHRFWWLSRYSGST